MSNIILCGLSWIMSSDYQFRKANEIIVVVKYYINIVRRKDPIELYWIPIALT